MSKLHKVLNDLIKEDDRLIKEEYKSLVGLHVGVRMNPRIFHEIMSEEDSIRYVTLDLQYGMNKIHGYPIEINPSVEEYEIVELQKHK